MKPNPFQTLGQVATTAAPAAPAANPFAGMVAGMNPEGFARPEAQAWLQQALAGPYMQGWGQPAAAGGGGAAAPASGAGPALTPAQIDTIKKQLSAQGNANQAGLYGGALAGLATGGPLGAFTSLVSSALTANKDGFLGSGIDGSWATKTLEKYGYKRGPGAKGYTSYVGPDGKAVGGQDLVVALMNLISTNNLSPKKSG